MSDRKERWTPGEWRIFDPADSTYVVEDERGGHITDFVTSKANAYLIASSPELYAVVTGYYEAHQIGSLSPCPCLNCVAARAALAKARGE